MAESLQSTGTTGDNDGDGWGKSSWGKTTIKGVLSSTPTSPCLLSLSPFYSLSN